MGDDELHTREDETKWNGGGRWADIVAQSNARNQTVLRPRCLESNARHSTVLYALLLRCFERSYRTCFETIPRRPIQLLRLIIIPRSVRSSDPTTLFSFSSIYFWQWFVRSGDLSLLDSYLLDSFLLEINQVESSSSSSSSSPSLFSSSISRS